MGFEWNEGRTSTSAIRSFPSSVQRFPMSPCPGFASLQRSFAVVFLLAALSVTCGGRLPGATMPHARAQSLTANGDLKHQSVSEQMAVAAAGDTVAVLLGEGQPRVEGVVKDQNERRIQITLLEGGAQTLDREIVYAVAQAGQAAKRRREEERSRLNPDHTNGKLFFLPTARRNDAGTSLVVNDPGLLLPYVDVTLPGGGLTLRAGSSAFPASFQYLHGGGKLVLIPLDRFSVAVGAVGGLSTNYLISDEYRDEWAGVGWAETTIDLRARENQSGRRVETTGVTLGAGYIKSGGFVGEGLMFMGGFEHRYGGNFKLLLEGEYLPEGRSLEGDLFPSGEGRAHREWMASAGVRYIGAVTTLEAGVLTGTPLLNASIPAAPILGFGLKVF